MDRLASHAPGTPNWFELGTTDQEGAKQFYNAMFDWSAVDSPMGPGHVYTMFTKDGADVAAAYTLAPPMAAPDVPPHWLVYFSIADADNSAAKVTSLGGSVMKGPFDVMTHGRMAVCTDPTGAVFALWQPGTHIGVGIAGEISSVCWTELATRDMDSARDFYTSLFGWTTKPNAGFSSYLECEVAGKAIGGIMPMDEQWVGIPPHWGIYFRVEDADEFATKALEHQGKVVVAPFDAPGVGRMAVLSDPQGVKFSVIALKLPDAA